MPANAMKSRYDSINWNDIQEKLNSGWSIERVAAEVNFSSGTVEKWISQGKLTKLKIKPKSEKMLIVQSLLDSGKSVAIAAKAIEACEKTIYCWIKNNYINYNIKKYTKYTKNA